MLFVLLLLFSALSVSVVSGYFSIVGLMTIFPGAATAVLAMGVVLEIAKLVTASWVYKNWLRTNKILTTYFISSVVILSLITSMGVFGFLSKAHLEHSILAGDNTLQIERIDQQISTEQRRVADSDQVIGQLDEAVQILMDFDRVRGPDGSIALRLGQSEERAALNSIISQSNTTIDNMLAEKLLLETAQLKIEVEIGPIKYIAEMIYGETGKETIDKAVRLVIILLILVFDPLAILLVVAANISLKERAGESITFLSEKDLEPLKEDFGIQEPPEVISKVVQTNTEEFTLTPSEKEQLNRLDRSLRIKLTQILG